MSPDDGRIADSLRIAEEKKVGIEFGEARLKERTSQYSGTEIKRSFREKTGYYWRIHRWREDQYRTD